MTIAQDRNISGQIHQNKPLANVSVAFKNTKLIASELSPNYPVVKESDNYYVYDMDGKELYVCSYCFKRFLDFEKKDYLFIYEKVRLKN